MPARSRLWPDPRVKPPYGAAELDRSHPLATSLQSFALFYGAAITDMTHQQEWLKAAGAGPGTGAGGDGTRPVAGVSPGVAMLSVTLAAGTNWSDFVYYSATSFDGGNPGLWRSGGGGGSTFHILQGGTNRVWIRLDGTDILMPGSGIAHTVGLQATGVSCISSGSITEYINGVQTQIASHAVATPAFNISQWGVHSDNNQQWGGVYHAAGIWSRALTAAETLYLHAQPYAMLRPIVRRRYFVAAPIPSPILTPPVGSTVFAPIGAGRIQDFRLTPATA